MIVRFYDRAFSKPLNIPGVTFDVLRMEWDIEGGCSRAVVMARAPMVRLSQLTQLLRCGAEIGGWSGLTGAGSPGWLWWGFVWSLRVGGLSVSLEELYNRAAVRYRDERPVESVLGGWQYQTAWVQDNASVNQYGKKEGIWNLGEAQTSEAEALAASMLARHKRPGWSPASSYQDYAVLELRGWFSTLGWQYFSEARGQIGLTAGGGSIQNVGEVGGNTLAAESFTVGSSGWTTNAAWIKVGKFGSPADNLLVQIVNNSGGAPGVSVLAAASIAGSTLNGESGWVKAAFATSYALSASTTYWLRIGRSGGLDANNYYRVAMDAGLPFAGGSALLWNGGAWVARVPDADLVFLVVGEELSTTQIRTMADPSAGGGQFFSSVFVKSASTVLARLYRSGRLTALEEVRQMLDLGDGSGGRLLAWVSRDRVLTIEAAGSSSNPEYLILRTGEVRRLDGGPAAATARLPGRWARVEGLTQFGGDAGPAGSVMITRAMWDKGLGKIRVAWE